MEVNSNAQQISSSENVSEFHFCTLLFLHFFLLLVDGPIATITEREREVASALVFPDFFYGSLFRFRV